jgi:POT family proton-dependent oligopeptide transporter
MVSFSLFISYHWRTLSFASIIIYYKLSPVKCFFDGSLFCGTGLGNKVAGIIGESASDLGEYSVFWNFDIIMGNIYDVAKTIKSINSRC